MSAASANEFMDRLESDEAFASSLAEMREDPEAVQAAVAAAGYDVTNDEIRTAFLERFGSLLSEEQLAEVAGGLSDGASLGLAIGSGLGILLIGEGGAAAAAAI
jgi:predicted ribosomally synthesized peptide with nif11-like leader